MSIHLVIPARFASSRLPGKPLVDLAGAPMIVRVLQRAASVAGAQVVAAVDDTRVADVVRAAGFEAVMTSPDHVSGSDRVMEVAELAGWPEGDLVVNVQGDEPLFPVRVVEELVHFMRAQQHIEIATISEAIAPEDMQNPNVVKVVTSASNRALYFSRANIPFARESNTVFQPQRHVGIYGFTVAALRHCTALPVSSLEQIEMLEQLRWLEADLQIYVQQASEAVPGGVDTEEDLKRVRALMEAK